MLNKLIMNLIKSFLNDIQDLYHGCDKGDVDNNEFYKALIAMGVISKDFKGSLMNAK